LSTDPITFNKAREVDNCYGLKGAQAIYAGKSPETDPSRNLMRRRQNRTKTQRSSCVLVDAGIKIERGRRGRRGRRGKEGEEGLKNT